MGWLTDDSSSGEQWYWSMSISTSLRLPLHVATYTRGSNTPFGSGYIAKWNPIMMKLHSLCKVSLVSVCRCTFSCEISQSYTSSSSFTAVVWPPSAARWTQLLPFCRRKTLTAWLWLKQEDSILVYPFNSPEETSRTNIQWNAYN